MSDTHPTNRGADHLVRAIQDLGTTTIYSLSGNQIMPVYDALIGSGIRLIHTRHEGAAVYMAEADAQISGRPGIALLTAGPGLANGLSAMYTALASETPLVVLTGDAPLGRSGQGAFQEMNQHSAAAAMAKASFTARNAAGLGEDLKRAAALALSGRPGPVHLSLPDDVLRQQAAPDAERASVPLAPKTSQLSDDGLKGVLDGIAAASRPLIVAGPTYSHAAHKPLVASAAAASGLPVLALESPRGLRAPRLGAFAEILPEADLIVLTGKQPDFMLGFASPPAVAPDCRFIAIEADPDVLAQTRANLGQRLLMAIEAAPSEVLNALASGAHAPRVAENVANGWTERVTQAIAHRPSEWESIPAESAPFHAACVAREVKRFLAHRPDTSLVIDGGEVGQWCQAILDAPVSLINGPSGAIGGGFPYAIAARAVRSEAPSIVIMGDGTAGFYFMEFETAVRENLPVIAIVGNDAKWNAEHQIQIRDYGPNRTMGCSMADTRYDSVAASLGGYGENVTEIADLLPAIHRAIASGKPACINVAIQSIAAPSIKLA